MSKPLIPDIKLLLVAGVWTLYYKGQEYLRLLDAASREDAEQQLSDMLLAVQAASNREAACSLDIVMNLSCFEN
jgi:hypothetical protein